MSDTNSEAASDMSDAYMSDGDTPNSDMPNSDIKDNSIQEHSIIPVPSSSTKKKSPVSVETQSVDISSLLNHKYKCASTGMAVFNNHYDCFLRLKEDSGLSYDTYNSIFLELANSSSKFTVDDAIKYLDKITDADMVLYNNVSQYELNKLFESEVLTEEQLLKLIKFLYKRLKFHAVLYCKIDDDSGLIYKKRSDVLRSCIKLKYNKIFRYLIDTMAEYLPTYDVLYTTLEYKNYECFVKIIFDTNIDTSIKHDEKKSIMELFVRYVHPGKDNSVLLTFLHSTIMKNYKYNELDEEIFYHIWPYISIVDRNILKTRKFFANLEESFVSRSVYYIRGQKPEDHVIEICKENFPIINFSTEEVIKNINLYANDESLRGDDAETYIRVICDEKLYHMINVNCMRLDIDTAKYISHKLIRHEQYSTVGNLWAHMLDLLKKYEDVDRDDLPVPHMKEIRKCTRRILDKSCIKNYPDRIVAIYKPILRAIIKHKKKSYTALFSVKRLRFIVDTKYQELFDELFALTKKSKGFLGNIADCCLGTGNKEGLMKILAHGIYPQLHKDMLNKTRYTMKEFHNIQDKELLVSMMPILYSQYNEDQKDVVRLAYDTELSGIPEKLFGISDLRNIIVEYVI